MSDFDSWENVCDEISEYLEADNCERKKILSFMVAAEEIFVNISAYAYPDAKGQVIIRLEKNNQNTVWLEFWDSGKEFNPLKVETPDLAAESNKRRIGGLGIHIARQKTDEMRYEYKDNKNHLTLIKQL